MPEGCHCWKPPHALGVLCERRGAPEGCAIALPRGCAGGGVPEECHCWKPPHALGGLLCGRRGAPEGCAIALPRGRAGGGHWRGVAVGSCRIPREASYAGGGVRRRGVP